MIGIIGKRIVQLILVLFGVSLLVFVMLRVLSPDPASIVLGQQATEQSKEEWRTANGLNQPIIKQYVDFAADALRGDFGKSYYTKVSVQEEIKPRFKATFELTFGATILACLLGIGIGTLCAVKKNQLPDYIGRIVSVSGVCVPIFFMGILLNLFFSNFLHILPSSGRIEPLLKPENITGFVLAGWKYGWFCGCCKTYDFACDYSCYVLYGSNSQSDENQYDRDDGEGFYIDCKSKRNIRVEGYMESWCEK